MKSPPDFISASLYGKCFQTGDEEAFNRLIFARLNQQDSQVLPLAHINLHGLHLYQQNARFKQYLDSTEYIWIDGMPIIWILKLLGYSLPVSARTTFLDWQDSFFARANEQELKIFMLGSSVENIQSCKAKLSSRFPAIQFQSHHGYFDHGSTGSDSNQAVVRQIAEFAPDVLLVGMGMPIQESWIHDNIDQLQAKVLMPIGGFFDYIAGATVTPNRTLSALGLEWLIRLINEPARLSRRYLLEPWSVVFKLLGYYVLRIR